MLRHISSSRHQSNESEHEPEWDVAFDTKQRVVPLKHAGMTIRMAYTEPRDTEEHLDKPTIVIKHGFGAARPAYHAYARALAAQGNRVVHYGMPRAIRADVQYHPRYLSDILTIHSRALSGVAQESIQSNPDGPDRVRVIGHSMGGIVVGKFIAHQPELVESAILLGSTGLHPHSFKEMALRGAGALSQEIIPYAKTVALSDKVALGLHSAWHLGRNPLLLLREGHHAATGDALQNVATARKAGVPVGAIWMNQDTFFPMNEIYETTRAQFDATLTVTGNHLKPQQFAKEAAEEALQLFAALEPQQHPSIHSITA